MKTPLSPRRRKLRITLWFVGIACILLISAGFISHRRSRPAGYNPHETSADITSELDSRLPAGAPKVKFTDVTAAAGLGAFKTYVGGRTSQLPEDMGPGAAWGDYDNDGDDDLFLVSAGGPFASEPADWDPCVLFQNSGDGTFKKVESFPELRMRGMSAAWGDYDGDGWLDLAVSGYDTLLLLQNKGGSWRVDARFENRKGFWAGVSWADFDRDNDLDLYVCSYVQYHPSAEDQKKSSSQLGAMVPFTLNPASYLAGTNLFFVNLGDGSFRESGAEYGVQNSAGRSLTGLWHDFDDDGWIDLYVANDISDNVFYRNVQGKFEDVSHSAWVADYRSAMGLAVGDYNRDGDDDLFVSHWVAQENALYDNLWADFQTGKRTNGVNQLPLRFMDLADRVGLGQIALQFVGWGAEFFDFDHDGYLDLAVANGSTLETEQSPKQLLPQESFLFWNQRGEHFYNVAPGVPALREKHVSRGLALSDFDQDGDLDVLLVHLGEGVQLLRNDTAAGHWIQLRLLQKGPAGKPILAEGARVVARVGAEIHRRSATGVSYLSQSSRTLHFGLGTNSAVAEIEVRWPNGEKAVYPGLAAGAVWEIEQGTAPRRKARLLAGDQKSGEPSKTAQLEFWQKQRAAMNALKVEQDPTKAAELFRAALAVNPTHEDSLYYLGQCLAILGKGEEALEQLSTLIAVNPQSHRGHQQWGILRARFSRSAGHLAEAEESLLKAHELNPEETGALLALGEIALMRGDLARAEERLAAACKSNPRAAGGLFLRGYIAWTRNETGDAKEFLQQAKTAFGPEWKPKGTTAEGDTEKKFQVEISPLSKWWEGWDGGMEPGQVFGKLQAYLSKQNG